MSFSRDTDAQQQLAAQHHSEPRAVVPLKGGPSPFGNSSDTDNNAAARSEALTVDTAPVGPRGRGSQAKGAVVTQGKLDGNKRSQNDGQGALSVGMGRQRNRSMERSVSPEPTAGPLSSVGPMPSAMSDLSGFTGKPSNMMDNALLEMLSQAETAADYWEHECGSAREELDRWRADGLMVQHLGESRVFTHAVSLLLHEVEALNKAWNAGEHLSFSEVLTRLEQIRHRAAYPLRKIKNSLDRHLVNLLGAQRAKVALGAPLNVSATESSGVFLCCVVWERRCCGCCAPIMLCAYSCCSGLLANRWRVLFSEHELCT